jgi:hypothetical protein
VVRLLLCRNDVDLNSKHKNFWDQSPLSHAALHVHAAVVRLLLDCPDVEVNSRDT